MPRRPLKWFVSAALIAIGCGGSPSNRSASPPPASVAGAKPGPPVAAAPEVPTPFRDPGGVPDQFRELWKEAVSGGEQGEWGGYTYRYAVRGDREVAVMLPRPIMRDDTIFVATVPDLAQRAFRRNFGFATTRANAARERHRLLGWAAHYYVLPIKQKPRGRVRVRRTTHVASVARQSLRGDGGRMSSPQTPPSTSRCNSRR